MPRHILQPDLGRLPSREERSKLLALLVSELDGSTKNVQPVILEERIRGTDLRQVQVIWDAWEDWPDEAVSELIREAYSQVPDETADDLADPIGVTAKDAVLLGLLGFSIISMRKASDDIPLEDYQRVYRAELKNTVLGTETKVARYPTLDDARAGLERLQHALPGSYWSIIREVGEVDDWQGI